MTVVVFAGPTLPVDAVRALLPDATVLPPARQGDVYRAVLACRPLAVGLIDGVFLHEPAVWHREILFALSEGIHVFGAASMGALRAAELFVHGMHGVGRVFSAYRDGTWPGFVDSFEDDDEVAVIHAPVELGAAPLSDSLVDLRDTLLAAEAAGLLPRADRDATFIALKSLPFPHRSFAALVDLVPALRGWLPTGKVPRKRLDAEDMLRRMAEFLRDKPAPFRPDFRFERVHAWDEFLRGERTAKSADEALVLEELRLRPAEYLAAARAALGRLMVADAEPTDGEIRAALARFRAIQGLARRADLDAWRVDNAAAPDMLARLLRDEAALTSKVAENPPGLELAIADHLRCEQKFAPLLRRARAKRTALGAVAPPSGPELDAALAWFADRHAVTLSVLRNDAGLADAVWREYVFWRRSPA
jgi:hypothetical protein